MAGSAKRDKAGAGEFSAVGFKQRIRPCGLATGWAAADLFRGKVAAEMSSGAEALPLLEDHAAFVRLALLGPGAAALGNAHHLDPSSPAGGEILFAEEAAIRAV